MASNCSRFSNIIQMILVTLNNCFVLKRFSNKLRLRLCLQHRCTQVENPGEGLPDVFLPKSLGGGSRLSGKIAWGVSLFWVLLRLY